MGDVVAFTINRARMRTLCGPCYQAMLAKGITALTLKIDTSTKHFAAASDGGEGDVWTSLCQEFERDENGFLGHLNSAFGDLDIARGILDAIADICQEYTTAALKDRGLARLAAAQKATIRARRAGVPFSKAYRAILDEDPVLKEAVARPRELLQRKP